MTSGRLQMRVTRNFGDWHTVFPEIPWSLVPKTTMDCHSKLVLHSLTNNQPLQVAMCQLRRTTLIFPGPCDETCCSILNVLQLVHVLLWSRRQNRVTIVVLCEAGIVFTSVCLCVSLCMCVSMCVQTTDDLLLRIDVICAEHVLQ